MKKTNKTLLLIFFTVTMLLLSVCNWIEFKYQLSIYYPQFPMPTLIGIILMIVFACAFVVFLILVIIGTISLILTLYHLIVNGESRLYSNMAAVILLISLCFVGYGTFFKNYPENKPMPLLRYFGGNELYRNNCIWYGDTIIYNHDTLVVNEKNNTCHWTYKPMVNYRIEYYKKYKFEQDTITK